jgi:Fe-S-cluster-containing dehydrogenase component/DMSO reductase anchor subunit
MDAPSLSRFAGGGPALVGAYLDRQQDLTAVERFSRHHDELALAGPSRPRLESHYRDLIPLEMPKPGQQFAFEVDLDRCTGCKACVTACHNLNGLDVDETWRSVGLIHSVRGKPLQQTVTTACQHCLEPGCSHGCPVKAYEKDPKTGVVKHLDDQCIGCEYCILKCPYDVPQYHHGKGIVRKCDMCIGRLEAGEAPACVQACPTKAIRIAVVDTAAVRANPDDYAKVAGAPDPRHTFPTTRYTTARRFPDGMEAADAHRVRPEKSHLPLVFMLSISQAAAGLYAMLEGATFLSLLGVPGTWIRNAGFQAWGHALALGLTLLAMAISVTHLGRPLYAFRAVLGLRRSWLSREIVAFGLLAPLGLAAAAASGLAALPAVPEPLAWIAATWNGEPGWALRLAVAAAAVLVVHCSAMVYRDTPRALWATRLTSAKFMLSGLASGAAVFLALAAWSNHRFPDFASGHLAAWMTAVIAVLPAVLAAKLRSEAFVHRHLDDQEPNPLQKAALLLRGELKVPHQLRFNAGMVGGMLLPILWLFRGVGSSSAWDFGLALAVAGLVIAGELLERYLFFTTCVPPRMPGG